MDVQELYYSRHGQTVDLTTGHRSRRNTKLTQKGWNEARSAGRILLNHAVVPSLIVCSGLIRAQQSAEAIAKIIGYKPDCIVPLDLLNERSWGDAEGVLNTEIKQRWPDGFDTVPGAETVKALQKRAREAATWLRRVKAETVLVVGHGTIGRAIVREFEGRPFTDEYSGERGGFANGQIARLYPQPTMTLTS